ncbi:MAG: PH domain-containing protein [Flavobacteriales bacterium]|nr:PH domain-containing protein [Flavobacteriales bacterium]
MSQTQIIKKAEFSLKIKTYILLSVGFFLFITIIGIPFLIIWLLGFGQYFSRRYYENLNCKLTSRHLIFRKGAFFMVEKTIPLENIQDLTFLQNPILNLLELRILKIETAGGSNPDGSDMKLVGIVEAEKFKQQVLDQRELLVRQPKSEVSESKKDESIEVLREIRDLLKEISSTKNSN